MLQDNRKSKQIVEDDNNKSFLHCCQANVLDMFMQSQGVKLSSRYIYFSRGFQTGFSAFNYSFLKGFLYVSFF